MQISTILFILLLVYFPRGNAIVSDNLGQNENGSIVKNNIVETNAANASSLNGTEDPIHSNGRNDTTILPASSQWIPDKDESNGNMMEVLDAGDNEEKNIVGKSNKQENASNSDEIMADRRSNIELTEITAYDWETGEDLMEGMLKNKQLFVRKSNGLLTFNAQKEGTTSPVQLRFEGFSPDTCNGKWHHLTLKICLAKKKVCKDGCAICYVGKMDPANRPSLLDSYQVPNLADTNNPDLCKKEDFKGWENKVVHVIYLKTNEDGNIEMSTSFSKGINKNGNKFTMKPNDDSCVFLQISSENGPVGTIMDADHQERRERDLESVWMYLANNGDVADLHFLNILPFDVFADFQENEPLLAFASSKDCGMEISINGPLKRCINQKCDKLVGYEQFMNSADKIVALYKTEFQHMKLILEQSDVPAEYSNNVMFRKKDDQTQAVMTTMGEEVIFAVITEKSDPPTLSFIRPADSIQCTEQQNFEVNELVLAYNGRPDCYGLFAWAPSYMRYRNDWVESKVLGVIDFPIVFKGFDSIWTTNQWKEPKPLGTGTCSIDEPEKYNNPRGVKDFPEEGFKIMKIALFYYSAYIWKFILNPKRSPGSTPILSGSRCRLGIAVNLDADYLLLTDFSDLYQELQEDDEQSTTTEENPSE